MEPVMITTKKEFVGKPTGTPDERQAVALEFIAHYLDRIDSHLERLVVATENSGNEKVWNIERALKK